MSNEIPGHKFQNFIKQSEEIKHLNKRIIYEEKKIVREMIDKNSAKFHDFQDTSKGHLKMHEFIYNFLFANRI